MGASSAKVKAVNNAPAKSLQRPSPLELYPIRTTYLVDIDKKILAIWPDLGDVDEDVSTHSDDIVSFIMDVFDKADL